MPLVFAELELYRHPGLVAHLRRLRGKVHRRVGEITVDVATTPEPVPFDTRLGLSYRRVRRGSTWGRAFTCAWFHVTSTVPPDAVGRLALILDIDGEALVRDPAGRVVAALSGRTTPVEQVGSPRGKTRVALADLGDGFRDGRIDIWLDAGFNGKLVPPYGRSRIKRLELVEVRDDIEAFYHDTLTCSYAAVAASGALRHRYRTGLAEAKRAFGAGSPSEVVAARAALEPLLHGTPDPQLAVTAVGHGHLDLAWLWPIRETRRKAERTLTYQLAQLDRHHELRYGVSQPQQLAWLEDQAPELFDRVVTAVADGRIELQGGMWVEPDTNLPSGESLVRQVLYGQRYWREKFGRTLDICWLPDVFGYSGNLPQILVKGGMTRFMTIKLSWNEHNDFPHRSFIWRGIDGSEVLVHMPPEGSYNSSATPLALAMLMDSYPEGEATGAALLVYGSGDGGGGPGPAHVEQVARLASLEGFPSVRHGTATELFDRLETVRDALPSHEGELYLEKHQGTYTTQAANKRLNQLLEHRLHDVEYLATLAWANGGDYPRDLLDDTWREVLLYQFHDILPGSSITRVHAESRSRYRELDADLLGQQRQLLASSPAGGPGLVNTLGTRRFGHLRHDRSWWSYDAQPFETVALTPATTGGVVVDGDTFTNEHLRVTFAADGWITSLVDRATGRDHAGEGLNRLVIHRDPWSYFDAWDINASYLKHAPAKLTPRRTETFTDGPRAVRRLHYQHGRSRIEQDVIVEAGSPYVLVETRVDWHETWRMLRAEHRPQPWDDQVSCQIQYGHLTRSTRDVTPEEKAQLEICAHQWVDVSDATGGLSLLNDSKYGHRVKDGLISHTLLRSPVYPDRKADRGHHEFRYALYPHAGPLTSADTLALAADLNAPLVVADIAAVAPVFTVDGAGVVIAAVKVAEAGDAVVLRAYETRGQQARVAIQTTLPVHAAAEVNLLEDTGDPVDLNDLSFGPFELRTFRLELRR